MTDDELPPVVARLWGRSTDSRRGPRPSLTPASVVGAAIDIADAHGLAGVTMSSVAQRVGVAPMSLYRYVGSKDDLVVMMTDGATPRPPEAGARGWRDYLTAWTRETRDFLVDHPWLLAVARATPPVGPRALLWLDRALAALEQTGLAVGERITIASTLSGYAASQAGLRLSLSAGSTGPAGEPAAATPGGIHDYGRLLAAVLDPGDYPALVAAVRGGTFEGGDGDWIGDADFDFGLSLLLDGVESLVARARPAP